MDANFPDECVIPLVDGRKLCCPAFPEPCTYVRIVGQDGEEQVYWDHEEWRQEPEEVMGAFMGALAGGKD